MNCAPTGRSSLRLRAIRALYQGISREIVQEFCKVSERTVLYWIARFNEQGIDGLISKPQAGRPRKIQRSEVQSKILQLVEHPENANQTHWTCRKLHGYLKEELKVEVGYSTLLRYLHQENYAQRFPRRWPANQDEKLREAFLRQLEDWCNDPEVELWFGDECGVEGDPRPRRRWVKRGSHPRLPYHGTHLRASVLGAICPSSGQLVSAIFEHCQTETFQGLLDTLADEAQPSTAKRRVLILDNASWHKTNRLNWNGFEPAYLPPYSPDFNPIERLWLRLKSDWFSDFIAKTPDELWDRICVGINALMQTPENLKSTCAITQKF